MRTLVGLVTALVILAGCGTSSPANLSAANRSGISVRLVHEGAVVATIDPGFRGMVIDVSGWGHPRTVQLTTVSGAVLGDMWDASEGEFNLDMAECGQVFLWLGGPDPSFEPVPSIPANACPGT